MVYISIYLDPHMTPIFEGQPPSKQGLFSMQNQGQNLGCRYVTSNIPCKSKTWQMIVFRMMPCFQDSLCSQLTNHFSWKTRGVFSEYTYSNRWFSGDTIVFRGVFKYFVVLLRPLKLKIYMLKSNWVSVHLPKFHGESFPNNMGNHYPT